MRFSFANKDINNYEELLWALLNQKRGGGKQSEDRSARIPKPIPVPTKPPRFFALIIGINRYKSYDVRPLKGAVPDANLIKKYLEDDLDVHPSHVRNLRDKEATRAAILQELRALATDDRIQHGDPIFIFYAGHGTTAPAPEGWEAGGQKIQLICPHDHLETVDGQKVVGIPDRTLGSLISNIAKKKGDNITVMFDCCHSGSGTRDDEFDPTRLVRGIEIVAEVPPDLDRDIWSQASDDRLAKIASGFAHSGLRSHTLLAACSATETAKEEGGRGIFTKALLETLRSVGAHKVTYKDLVSRIPLLPAQNPQCEGVNSERVLFNARAPSRGRVLHKIRVKADKYLMDAGAAHGITDGAEFSVHKHRDDLESSLGNLIVVQTSAFSSILEILPYGTKFKFDGDAYALQTRAGAQEDLRIHVALDDRLTELFEALAMEMQKTGSATQKILLDSKEKSVLDLQIEKDRIVFNILDPLVTVYGLRRMPYDIDIDVDAALPVVRAAAHYYWHLNRTTKTPKLQGKIQVEVYELEEAEGEYDEDLQAVLRPKGPNLKRGDIVDVVADGTKYGVKIINTTNIPLYPSVFFFSHGDLSIQSYFETPTAVGKVDAPLLPKGSLTIGYGSGGAAPYEYYLMDGQDVDVGFLKLFLSSERVDLSHVPQASPFSEGRGGKPSEVRTEPVWDTIVVPIIQRKEPLPSRPSEPQPEPEPSPAEAENEQPRAAVGTANTMDVRPWDTPQPETTKIIKYDNPPIVPQILPLGLTSLDIDRGNNIRVVAEKQDLGQEGFKLSLNSWDGSALYSAGASWLELPQQEKHFQWGEFSTLEVHSRSQPEQKTSHWIHFSHKFSEPPKVVVFLSGLDMLGSRDWRVTTTASDITHSGFRIHVDTWADSVLYCGNVGWIAYPHDRKDVHSGRVDTRDIRSWIRPQLKNSKAITFDGANFQQPPKVFFALDSLNIDRSANLRIKASVSDVTTTGMTWHLDSWHDTIQYSAGMSYICVA